MPEPIIGTRPNARPWNEITTMVFGDQLRLMCKLNLAFSCIILVIGIFAASIPSAGFYMTGITLGAHCFWGGGLVSRSIRYFMIKLICSIN